MGSDLALQLMADLMWNALIIGAPLMAATLVVGVLVSVVQVVTQIQEASLSFVPKLIVAGAVLLACGPWMLRRLVNLSVQMIANIPSYF